MPWRFYTFDFLYSEYRELNAVLYMAKSEIAQWQNDYGLVR